MSIFEVADEAGVRSANRCFRPHSHPTAADRAATLQAVTLSGQLM
jgi:hypothetical protein